MVVNIINEKFNAHNQAVNDIIENPVIIITEGSRTWYQFGFGDAGCGGLVYKTQFIEKTLKVSFISCSDDEEPFLDSNEDLQLQILSTFLFSE